MHCLHGYLSQKFRKKHWNWYLVLGSEEVRCGPRGPEMISWRLLIFISAAPLLLLLALFALLDRCKVSNREFNASKWESCVSEGLTNMSTSDSGGPVFNVSPDRSEAIDPRRGLYICKTISLPSGIWIVVLPSLNTNLTFIYFSMMWDTVNLVLDRGCLRPVYHPK